MPKMKILQGSLEDEKSVMQRVYIRLGNYSGVTLVFLNSQ